MVHKLSEKIMLWGNIGNDRTSVEKQVILYGIELWLENVIKIAAILIISGFFHKFIQTCIFLCIFCGLRAFAGGFHMQTSFGCLGTMVTLWIAAIVGSDYLVWNPAAMLAALAVVNLSVWLLAPVDTENNPITDAALRKHKKYMAGCLTAILTAAILLIKAEKMQCLLLLSLLAEAITLLPFDKILNLRRKIS